MRLQHLMWLCVLCMTVSATVVYAITPPGSSAQQPAVAEIPDEEPSEPNDGLALREVRDALDAIAANVGSPRAAAPTAQATSFALAPPSTTAVALALPPGTAVATNAPTSMPRAQSTTRVWASPKSPKKPSPPPMRPVMAQSTAAPPQQLQAPQPQSFSQAPPQAATAASFSTARPFSTSK